MKSREEIHAWLKEIEADQRLKQPPASWVTNAPLAVVQMDLEATRDALRWVLDMEPHDEVPDER